jgi:hypothetical protein
MKNGKWELGESSAPQYTPQASRFRAHQNRNAASNSDPAPPALGVLERHTFDSSGAGRETQLQSYEKQRDMQRLTFDVSPQLHARALDLQRRTFDKMPMSSPPSLAPSFRKPLFGGDDAIVPEDDRAVYHEPAAATSGGYASKVSSPPAPWQNRVTVITPCKEYQKGAGVSEDAMTSQSRASAPWERPSFDMVSIQGDRPSSFKSAEGDRKAPWERPSFNVRDDGREEFTSTPLQRQRPSFTAPWERPSFDAAERITSTPLHDNGFER